VSLLKSRSLALLYLGTLNVMLSYILHFHLALLEDEEGDVDGRVRSSTHSSTVQLCCSCRCVAGLTGLSACRFYGFDEYFSHVAKLEACIPYLCKWFY
jgi:hypothetical protein